MVKFDMTFRTLLAMATLLPRVVDGHGYLQTPRTRNRVAAEEGSDNGGEGMDGKPLLEYCAHCLNRKAENQLCGGNYDDWLDVNGNPMPWVSQETYIEGQEFEIDGTLTTNHAGHMEIYLCNMGRGSTTECLRANPAVFVSDPIYDGPKDPTYPERAYFSNDADYRFIYKIPEGFFGDQVLVQWRYITANSCIPPGYRDDPVYSRLKTLGWLRSEGMADCDWPTNETGEGVPEQFWNCAEISVLEAGPTISPRPTPPPVDSTPAPVSLAPITAPNSAPTTPPNPPGNGYCNWSNCDGEVQGGPWCNENQDRCEIGCSGTWCMNNGPTPTNQPGPTPTAPAPTPAPTPAQPTPSGSGYCNWGDDGTAAGSVCNGEVQGGEWCNISQDNCESECSGRWCTGNDPAPTPPAPTPPAPTPPAPTGGMTATTTRYWDCSGGSCGCAYLPFPNDPSSPAHCYSNAMFSAPENNAYGAKFYGTAAVSQILFDDPNGDGWLGNGCGRCYRVTGTSNTPGYEGNTATTLVLKAANYCPPGNPLCSGNKVHFDIAAPGFDVLAYSLSHACPELESAEVEGFQACSNWMINNQDPNLNCDCSKFGDPILRAGCENFLSMQWDNAVVDYEEVGCPAELDRLNCWEENGDNYPLGIPEFCASNLDDNNPAPTPPVSAPPTVSSPVDDGYTEIFFEGFETVDDDGKYDGNYFKAVKINRERFRTGTSAAQLNKEKKLLTKGKRDVRGFSTLKIHFFYRSRKLQDADSFKFEYKFNGSAEWTVAREWIFDTDFENSSDGNPLWYEETVIITIPDGGRKILFRFSKFFNEVNNGQLYFDDVTFSGMASGNA